MYDPNSIPYIVIKEASSGTVDILNTGNQFVLYNNNEQWMTYNHNDDVIKQMYSSYDLAYGDVLISGLGFGILALWLCTKTNVNSVTVIEISEDVIKLFKNSNSIPDKLNIINSDMTKYNTDKEYDALLLDHYELQNFDWILNDIKKISSRIKHKNIWAWPLEGIYLFKMYANENYETLSNIFIDDHESNKDFYGLWINFLNKFFPKEKMLKDIKKDQLNNYIYTYCGSEYANN